MKTGRGGAGVLHHLTVHPGEASFADASLEEIKGVRKRFKKSLTPILLFFLPVIIRRYILAAALIQTRLVGAAVVQVLVAEDAAPVAVADALKGRQAVSVSAAWRCWEIKMETK